MTGKRGTSILGVTVGLGLLGGGILITSAFMRQSFMSSRKVASLGEAEDLRQFVRLGINCSRTFTGFPTPSGWPNACHTGAGPLALLRRDGTALVPAGGLTLGQYEIRATCPGPGPAGCGCANAGCTNCGDRARIEYRHQSRPDEREWKDLFGTNVTPCDGGGGAGNQEFFAGTTTVRFFNGQAHSTFTTVPFPFPCNNPIIVTQSVSDSIACGSAANPQVLGTCPDDPGSRSQDLHSYFANVTANGFRVFLSGSSGVCVGISGANPPGTPCGATSPNYRINYFVACN